MEEKRTTDNRTVIEHLYIQILLRNFVTFEEIDKLLSPKPKLGEKKKTKR